MVRTIVGFATLFILSPTPSWAQGLGRLWFNVDYTYTDFTHKQPGIMTESGSLAGVRGEFGFYLFSNFGLSAGGEYQDGNLDYDGATFGGTQIKQTTKDYFRRTEILGHLAYGGFILSAGVAERYWYDDLVVSYRRRTRYNYNPIYLTYRMQRFYVRYEQDLWKKGWNKSHMHDVNTSATDVEFTLGKGTGYGAEIGLFLPGLLSTRVFVAYHKWSVKESDSQSDGTQILTEPESHTTEVKAGLGLAF